jgi:hypothetical protein
MTGTTLRNKPVALWDRTIELLRHADLEKIKAQFPDYPHPNFFRAIQVSVEALDSTARERYLALAVMLEDMSIHPMIQQTLWNVDDGLALETAEQFVSLSLAQCDDAMTGDHDVVLVDQDWAGKSRRLTQFYVGAYQRIGHSIRKSLIHFLRLIKPRHWSRTPGTERVYRKGRDSNRPHIVRFRSVNQQMPEEPDQRSID